jgi:prephenate dehydrogenase
LAVASVIGAAGRMGGWFANFLKKNQYKVIVCDTDNAAAKNLAHKKRFRFAQDQIIAVKSADLILITTPTQVTRKILSTFKPETVGGKVIVEISSVKAPVRKTIDELRRKGAKVLSIHPMFGPGTRSLLGKTVLVTSRPDGSSVARQFLSLFSKNGAKLLNVSYEQHDRLISMLLTLPHFVNLALVDTLRTASADPNQLRAIGGTSFGLQFLTAEAIFHEDLRNELSILMDSKYGLDALRSFAQRTSEILVPLSRERRGEVLGIWRSGRKFLERDKAFSSAYRRFNAAVEASALT